jgi:hypothetical protein
MTVAPANTSSIIVAVTGVLQDPSTYSVSGTTLTFSAAPPSGTSNISVRYLGIPASGVTTTAYRTVTNFTATAGQTSFSVPSYTVGYIDVYRNGVRLVSTDYTATTGTTVVLNNACTVGDAVVTESFLVSSVLNAIPNSPASVGTSNIVSGVTLTSPTLVTPALGTPASGVLTNCTGLPQAGLGTNVAGNGPAFSATPSTTQTVTTATYTKVNLGTENFDTNSNFSSSRFTPTIAGYYQLNASVYLAVSGGVAQYIWSIIYKNGVAAIYGNLNTPVGAGLGVDGIGISCGLLYMNGTTDYVESYVYASASAGTIDVGGAGTFTVFSGVLVRGA